MSHPSLSNIPTELVLRITSFLPSLPSALPLLSTCRRFRQILHSHAHIIYTQLDSNPCRCQALILLRDCQAAGEADEKVHCKTPTDAHLTLQDIFFLFHCYENIQKAINIYEAETLAETRAVHYRKRSPHLTASERRRFIRTYYIVWSLVLLPPPSVKSRLEALTMRQLWYLTGVSHLSYRMSPLRLNPSHVQISVSTQPLSHIRNGAVKILRARYEDFYHVPEDSTPLEDVSDTPGWRDHGGHTGHASLLDFFQDDLKRFVWTFWMKEREAVIHGYQLERFTDEFVRRWIWDESEEEDVGQ